MKSLRYRYYNVNDPFWGENLRDAIQSMIKSVLEQPDMPMYLEGITANLELPNPPKKGDINLREVSPIIDISGNWKLNFTGGEIDHQGIAYINQQGDELSATTTITFDKNNAMTVVQEVLTGTIRGTDVSLTGVSYTYIHQGKSKHYTLDAFDLILGPDMSVMKGEFSSADTTGQVIFTKQDSITDTASTASQAGGAR